MSESLVTPGPWEAGVATDTSSDLRRGWKVTTHDLRPPVMGGAPLWDEGRPLPVTLGPVQLDQSGEECGAGLNYCATLAGALRIAGLWPNGRPSRGWVVNPASQDAIERSDKRRASSLTLPREVTPQEIAAAIYEMSAPFGQHQARMATEQLAWREALARPRRDADAVEHHLREALAARGLKTWKLKRFDTARAAGNAGYVPMVGRAALASWETSDAGDSVWGNWDAWAVRTDAWGAGGVWCAGGVWGAGCAARDALTVCYASLQGWISQPPERLTVGLRHAYRCGLAIAVPVASATLGWAMDAMKDERPQ